MGMYQHLGDRLKSRRKELNLTQQAVADSVGVSKTAVIFWEKGENVPKHESLILLAKALGTSPEWLLHGKDVVAELANDKVPLSGVALAQVAFNMVAADGAEMVSVPIYSVKAACGNGYENPHEEISGYMNFDPAWLKMQGITANPKYLRIIFSTDYSMWPTVEPDSMLIVDTSDADPSALKTGKIYVFRHSGELRMKRVFISLNGAIKLTSDNPDKNQYPEEVITQEQAYGINIIGRVVWRGGEL